ncbi:unnamed protein product [Calypogeia fissa]
MGVGVGGRSEGYLSQRMLGLYMLLAWLSVAYCLNPPDGTSRGTFDQLFQITWAPDHVQTSNGDTQVKLTLDQVNTSSFASKGKYQFGYLSTGIKLIPRDSAGTVTAYYLASDTGNTRDELDFEFLGNSSGQPYTLQTNIFANGIGRREQRIFLWFDPSADFHNYAVLWNKKQIVFYVDDYPIRIFENKESEGIAFPTSQPMGISASLWNGDSWATQGGAVKLNWTYAPFEASFGSFDIQACDATSGSNCASGDGWWSAAEYQSLGQADISKLKWVQQNYMIYDYCTDTLRYAQPPPDCVKLSGM